VGGGRASSGRRFQPRCTHVPPFRRIFEATNVVFRRETVESIDVQAQVVHTRANVDEQSAACHREIRYDALVLAPGSETQTFRTPGVAENAFFMRELGDAVAVRNHIIDCFELAAQEASAERRAAMLRFVVVGGGPTGVELMAEIRDLVEHVLFVRYPEVKPDEVDLVLVQSAPQLLPGWHPTVVQRATEQLHSLEVRVLTGRKVQSVSEFAVTLDQGEILAARTTVWCAGVKPAGLLGAVDLPKHPSGRVPVGEDLRVPGHPAVFVLGDASLAQHQGKPLPPLGQVAFQQGTHTGENLARLIRGEPLKPFRYFDYGSLVSVGEHFAPVALLGVRISGALAWLSGPPGRRRGRARNAPRRWGHLRPMLGPVVLLLLSASPVQTLRVEGEAGNNTLNGVFDAPLGERIVAVSAAVGCDIQVDPEARNLSGRCSVPLNSITVDADPTKTEHFRQWATNRKVDAARCMLTAQLERIAVSLPEAPGASTDFQAEVPSPSAAVPATTGGPST